MEQTNTTRRTFLKGIIAAAGGAIAVGLGYPIIRYLIAPAIEKPSQVWISLGPTDQFQVNNPVHVTYAVQTKDAWYTVQSSSSAWVVKKSDTTFEVFNPACTHLGCPYNWDPSSQRFLCPCHGGVFDIDGNRLAGPPPRNLDQYAYRIENGNLMISEVTTNA